MEPEMYSALGAGASSFSRTGFRGRKAMYASNAYEDGDIL